MSTETKPHPETVKLTPGAEAVLAFMRATGDSLVDTIDGTRHYWGFSKCGLPIDRRFVDTLIKAKHLKPFGSSLLVDDLPQCLVLADQSSAAWKAARREILKKAAKAGSKKQAEKAANQNQAPAESAPEPEVEASGKTPCGADDPMNCKAGRGHWCSSCCPVGLYKRHKAGEVQLQWVGDPL